MPERPNIVLICVDQWRGDAFSHMGHPVVRTPWLDQMAMGGASFRRAYSAVPSCIAARASLFTGLSQRSHGRVGYCDGVEWNYPVTLAGEFTRHGYQTQAVGKMHVYPERSQLGFQNVILHDGYLHFARDRRKNPGLIDDYMPWLFEQMGSDADYFEHGLNCNSNVARPWDKPEHVHPTNFVVTQSIDFLRRRDPRKPFFLFMSFHRPHPPYDPPAWAFEQYLHETMPPRPVGDWVGIFAQYEKTLLPDAARAKVDPRVLQRALAGYYGHMTHIDHQINRFLEMVHEYGAHQNTYVCFVSDHGELIGDHHLFRKSCPYEGSTRVPLILRGPQGSGIAAGSQPEALAELRDVMPTLLDCAGLPIPDCVEGKSLLPAAKGDKSAVREYLHGEHGAFGGSMHWLTDGRQKYIWLSWSGHEQLFDLQKDPQEMHDLAADSANASAVGKWREKLICELTDREEGYVDGGKLVPGGKVTACLSHLFKK